jgi:hypothetical protein
VFASISKLNYHTKDYHPADALLKNCGLCQKQFVAISVRRSHEENGCPKEREVVWVPPEVIHDIEIKSAQKRVELGDKFNKILQLFKEYLIDGSSSTVLLSRGKQNLEKSSVDSYVSHFRVFAGFVEVRLPSF